MMLRFRNLTLCCLEEPVTDKAGVCLRHHVDAPVIAFHFDIGFKARCILHPLLCAFCIHARWQFYQHMRTSAHRFFYQQHLDARSLQFLVLFCQSCHDVIRVSLLVKVHHKSW